MILLRGVVVSRHTSRKLNTSDHVPASPPDPRRQGPLFVEARGLLQPSVDFYTGAVRSADATGATSGDLLCSVSIPRELG